jgi:hypothetical protein
MSTYRKKKTKEGWNKERLARPFLAIDGEGGNLDNGYHAYFLLRAGDECLRADQFGQTRLTTVQCLDFLCRLPDDVIVVGYFLDYDVTKWLEDLPWEKLNRLINRKLRRREDGKGSFPVSYSGFEIDYLPKKEFKVRRRTGSRVDEETGETKPVYGPWKIVNDVGSFFQCRFVESLERWKIGSEEQRQQVEEGKEARAEFTPEGVTFIDSYNMLEIELLQKLMEKFRDACFIAGYMPRKWQGPGQLAEAAFRRYDVPVSADVPVLNDSAYTDLLLFAGNAFYGGRPELSVVGPVDRKIWQWDINSAYPFAMKYVPCLIHGVWKKGKVCKKASFERRDGYAICFGSFEGREGDEHKTLWYGLPFRDEHGSICYPQRGKGWYWNFEIEAAKHQTFSVEECWQYERRCDCVPLEFVEDVYEERLRIGKDSSGHILKLLLNSLYGKCAQSVGKPKYANPIWASFITAVCRSMVQEFIHRSPLCAKGRCGTDVVMVATDSVSTWTPREDMADSRELGSWSVELHPDGMLLVQPGLYFGSSGKRAKTRGVPLSAMEGKEGEFKAAFERMCQTRTMEDGDVYVPQRMFVGIRYALHRRNLKLLGQWIEFGEEKADGKKGKRISFDWKTKRRSDYAAMPGLGQTYVQTFPKIGDIDVCTTPYSKDIGGLQEREQIRSWFEATPDWEPILSPTEREVL